MEEGILFLGDSFTWGEGLELYCNTQKWIAERNNPNTWLTELSQKQDEDSIRFREENRFPALVAKHFGVKAFVNSENGGSLIGNVNVAQNFLFDPTIKINTIIMQFSILDREPMHGSLDCNCELCTKAKSNEIFDKIQPVLYKLINNIRLDETENIVLNFFEEETKRNRLDTDFIASIIDFKKKSYDSLLYNFFHNHLAKWSAQGKRKIYYIDSWDKQTSDRLQRSVIPINQCGIPLIGNDGKKYLSWWEWEKTFKFRRISEEFTKTGNGHPTLIQHQYLARSIIEFLIKKREEASI